jgi:GntR family transcriptional regulator/MocR family aminotransferase
MRLGSGAIVLIDLDGKADVPLHRQIYDELRRQILDGRLRRGARLPSSRSLATDLCVSRSTVVQAFEQLRAEGYIESVSRGSTRISARLPDSLVRADAPPVLRRSAAAQPQPSHRGAAIRRAWPQFAAVSDRPARPFRTSVPALDVFPVDIWGRLSARRWRRSSPASLAYSEPRGLPALREAIADYLTSARAVRCRPEHIMITSGSQQALDIVARATVEPGDQVWMEDPGYFGAGGAFVAAGARLVPVPVDASGLNVAEGIRRAPQARAAFVTPARQLPLGVTMPLERRLELLAWADHRRAWILEDDYDSEFRYSTRPLASLQGLDSSGCVIFTGTFSKVMFPALRLGYLVVPEPLLETVSIVRRSIDFCPPYLSQAVMADFIREGHFERHIRQMRAIYQARRALFVKLLTRECAGLLEVDAPDAGMNLIAWLPDDMSDATISEALKVAGVDSLPLSSCAMKRRLRPGLLLGFSGIREADIRDGVGRLTSVLRAARLRRSSSRRSSPADRGSSPDR